MAFRDPLKPLIARLFATNTPPHERIEIDSYRNEGPTTGSQIRFYKEGQDSSGLNVSEAAKLLLATNGLDPSISSVTQLIGTDYTNNATRASVNLYEMANGTDEITFGADRLWLNNGLVQRDVNNDGVQMWNELTQTPMDWAWPGFQNGWTDLAGSRAGYWTDATGVVHLRGIVISGTAAATIATFPADARPSQTMDFTVRQAGGVIVCAFQINAVTGALTASGNATTVSGSGARLDGITWPTHQ